MSLTVPNIKARKHRGGLRSALITREGNTDGRESESSHVRLDGPIAAEHPFETEKQIMKRYGERLVADPELMEDAMRGALS